MRTSLVISLGVALVACGRSVDPPPLFERLAPSVTGVSFENRLPEDSTLNILNFLYYYNGGGVAAGDVDGDGRPDLYFTSNLGSNRLYLNRGGYRFEDVTARAGVAGPTGWKSGVTMADVDGDGRLDIYVSTVSYRGLHGRNALYVNNGDGTFTDRAHDVRNRLRGLRHAGGVLRLRRRRRSRSVRAELLDARRSDERRAEARCEGGARRRTTLSQRRRAASST